MPATITARVHFQAEPIKGSRFRAMATPITSQADADVLLAEIRGADPDATHHAWALRLAGGDERCADDGEVSGTAGRPILARLQGEDLVDVLVVVSRWYGGTRLGKGGLVRAYGRTAAAVLARAHQRPWIQLSPMTITFPYSDMGAVQSLLAERGLAAEDTAYGAVIRLALSVPATAAPATRAALRDATAGRVRFLSEPG